MSCGLFRNPKGANNKLDEKVRYPDFHTRLESGIEGFHRYIIKVYQRCYTRKA
jgi:hypothetical protein